MPQHFPYEVDKRYLPVLLPLVVRPAHDGVRLTDDGRMIANLGLFKVSTEISNIEGAHITRGYRWWTSVGVRLSMADDGLTLGTNNKAGVCIHFREKVPSLVKPKGHSALTVTVADLDGLTDALGRLP